MLELPMASACRHQSPTVLIDPPQEIANLHGVTMTACGRLIKDRDFKNRILFLDKLTPPAAGFVP
jgi:hypothetical protein